MRRVPVFGTGVTYHTINQESATTKLEYCAARVAGADDWCNRTYVLVL